MKEMRNIFFFSRNNIYIHIITRQYNDRLIYAFVVSIYILILVPLHFFSDVKKKLHIIYYDTSQAK